MKYSLFIFIFFFQPIYAQKINLARKIDWQVNRKMVFYPTQDKKNPQFKEYLYFQGANYPDVETLLPQYYELIDAWKYFPDAKIKIEDKKFEVVDTNELTNIQHLNLIKNQIISEINTYQSDHKDFIQISVKYFLKKVN